MPANVTPVGDDALTLDMVGQMAYCPRRFHLMYVEGRWADNAYTIDGRRVHKRVDAVDHVLPAPANDDDEQPRADQLKDKGDAPPTVSRSCHWRRRGWG